MKTSQQLERELAEARERERLEQEDKEMNQLIDNYVGKAYGTKSFTQKTKLAYYQAIYIESIERYTEHKNCTAEGTIVCSYRFISFNNGPDWKSKHKVSSYNRGLYDIHLNKTEDRNMSYHMWNLTVRKSEIPVELFEQLYSAGEEIDAMLVAAFKGKITLSIQKTCGDGTSQDEILKNHKRMGIELIDLEKYPELLHSIRYARLPGVLEDRFLVKEWAVKSLELQVSILEEEMSSAFCVGRVYDAKNRELKVIQTHIIMFG